MAFSVERTEAMQSILDAIPNPIFVKDRAHRIVLINASACAFFGHSRESLLGAEDTDLFPAEQLRIFNEADDLAFATGCEAEDEEQVTDAAGRTRHVITRKRVTRFDGADYVVASVTDISVAREAQARSRYLEFHDELTGLPNRTLLKQRLEEALQRRTHGSALLYIDLDRFKDVNDTYGRAVGDQLLRSFARRLSEIVRASDTVARLGSDEFAVLLTDTSRDPNADEVSRRALVAAAQAFEVAGVEIQVGASIGVVLTGREAIDEAELQRRADLALNQAKNEGRGCFRIFTQALGDRINHRHGLQADLRAALAAGTGLEVHYQPLVRIASGEIEGFEALTRWQHPTRGLVMPSEFIPVAEASGLIIELDEWVLARACADAVQWDPARRLAVNVSAVQFAFGDLAAMVERVVRASGLDPARLELEITEGVLIQDPEVALRVFSRLKAFGVQIVLDDFGVGYSSLSYFREFPFDKVKIDRSFVADMLDSRHAQSIVAAMIALARGLDIEVVAEGVETITQLAALTKLGCTQGQGYLFGRPAPIGELNSGPAAKPLRVA